MEDFFDQDSVKAFVYLLAEGDEKNKMMISDDQLIVIRKGKRDIFPLDKITAIKPDNKKLLLPLILGGVIVPFAFLSFFANLFHPWFHLILILLGMYLFYEGWSGRVACTILLGHGNERHFYLPSISHNLRAFMDYVNSLKSEASELGHLLFFEVEEKSMDELFSTDETRKKSPFFPWFGYTFPQYKAFNKAGQTHQFIVIDPSRAGREIKFEYNQSTKQMHPKLGGPIRKEALVRIMEKHW